MPQRSYLASEQLNPDNLSAFGAERYRALLTSAEISSLRELADGLPPSRAGARLFGNPGLLDPLGPGGCIGRLARSILGAGSRPVRAVLFDKKATTNWAVPWHQDRTIAVRRRVEVTGFGPWSVKDGVPHVEPPFPVLASMITLRAHLDDCDAENSPLLIAPGSHRLGRIAATAASRLAARLGSIACPASTGDVWVYATPILHSSERSRSPNQRRVLHVDFAPDDLPGGLEWMGIDDRSDELAALPPGGSP
ncbi:MAG TPA: phytanoyl-CoA dioxygenase family protein [Stellaceae bacterium]|nr:phytanoyl-CoA dioxygenase family protein [Stellaceae bacterium]